MASPKIKPITVKGKIKYQFVADVGVPPNRRQIRRRFDRKRDAQAALAKILHQVNQHTYIEPSKIPTGEYLAQDLRSRPGKEAATRRNYADALRPVVERLGHVPLRNLTTTMINDLRDWMLTSGRRRGGKVGSGLSNPGRCSSRCPGCAQPWEGL